MRSIYRKEQLRRAAYTGDVGACENLAVYLIEGVKAKIKKVNNGVTKISVSKKSDFCKRYASLMIKSSAASDFVEAVNNLDFIQNMGGKLKRFNFSKNDQKDCQRIVELINSEELREVA